MSSVLCYRLDAPKPPPQASSSCSIRRTSSLSTNVPYYSSSASPTLSSAAFSCSSTSSAFCLSSPPMPPAKRHHLTNCNNKSMNNMNEISDHFSQIDVMDNTKNNNFHLSLNVPSVTTFSIDDDVNEQDIEDDEIDDNKPIYLSINHRSKLDSSSNLSAMSVSHLSIHRNLTQCLSPPFDHNNHRLSSLPSSITSSPMSSTADSDIMYDHDHYHSPKLSMSSFFTSTSPNCYSDSSHQRLSSPSISTSSSIDGHITQLTGQSSHYSDYQCTDDRSKALEIAVSGGNSSQNNLYLTSNCVSLLLTNTSPSKVTITMKHFMNQFQLPISQIQAWALIYQSTVSLQSLSSLEIVNSDQTDSTVKNNQKTQQTSFANLPEEQIPDIILDSNGNVSASTWFPQCDTNPNISSDDEEVDSSSKSNPVNKYRKMVNDRINRAMRAIALLVASALSFTLPDDQEADLELDLENLIYDIINNCNSDTERNDRDEGIEEPDDSDTFSTNCMTFVRRRCVNYFNSKIKLSNRRLIEANSENACQVFVLLVEKHGIDSIDADLYYKAVCEAMVTETIKLGNLLKQFNDYRNKNGKANKNWQNSSGHGENQDETRDLKLWAQTWIKVMSEMRFEGIKLRQVNKDEVKPIRSSQSSQLMEQIRMKRTVLRKTPVNQNRDQLSQSISFPVIHGAQSQYYQPPITQTMILDRLNNLKSANDRNLSPIQPRLPCLHERLMIEIRARPFKLRPTETISKPSESNIREQYLSERNNRYRRQQPMMRPNSEIVLSHNNKGEALNRLLSFPNYGQISDQYASDDTQLNCTTNNDEEEVKGGLIRKFQSLRCVHKKHKRKNLNESDIYPSDYCISGQIINSESNSGKNPNHTSLSIFSSNLFTSPRKSNRTKKNKKNDNSRNSCILLDDPVAIRSASIVDNNNMPLVRFSSVSECHLWMANQNQPPPLPSPRSKNSQSTPIRNSKNVGSLMLPPLSPISVSTMSLHQRSPLQILGSNSVNNATNKVVDYRSQQSILNTTASDPMSSSSSSFNRSKLNTLLRRSFVRKASSFHRQISEINDQSHRHSSFYDDSRDSNYSSMNTTTSSVRSFSNWNLSRLWNRLTSNLSSSKSANHNSPNSNSKIKEE